ncbi:hAT family dimerization domain protein [Paraphaeosphaeria sporulosa]
MTFLELSPTLSAQIIYDVAIEYRFTRKLHYFVGDNAANNGITFLRELHDITTEDLYIATNRRIRCAGHIINLISKALIYGSGVSNFESELAKASPEDQYAMFQARGAIGKLHNFVNAVCNSHKRRRLFQSIQRTLLDDDKLFSFSLARADSSTMDEKYNPTVDALTDDEWDEIRVATIVLETFYKNTKGEDEVSVYQVDGFEQSEYIVSGVKLALEKLGTYFQKLVLEDAPSLYCVATAMHPCLRLSWFKFHWKLHPQWHKAAEKSIREVYKQYLAAEAADGDGDGDDELPELPRTRKVPGAYATDERRLRTMFVDDHLLTGKKTYKRQKRTSQLDEYFDSLYDDKLAASSSPDLYKLLQDPHRWWTEVGQKRYPVVYKMAIDHLSVPATSCDSVIEALQLQKNWLRRDAVHSHLTKLAAHVTQKDAKPNVQLADDDPYTSHLPN